MLWSDSLSPHSHAEGVTVTVPTRAELLRDLDNHLATGRGFSLATLNLDHVTKLRTNVHFLDAYLSHTHVTADGNPIVWLSRVAGQPVELLPGSELIVPVAELAAKRGVPIALFGSTQDSLDAAALELDRRIKGLKVAAAIRSSMSTRLAKYRIASKSMAG